MRRLAILTVCLAAFVLIAAPPAFAQRDPFDPVITEETGTADTTTTTSSTTTETTDTDPTTPTEPPADEPMPSTGGDPSRWLGVASLVLAMGGGLLIAARMLGPVPAHPRRRA